MTSSRPGRATWRPLVALTLSAVCAFGASACGGSKETGAGAAGDKPLRASFGTAAGDVPSINWGLPYGEPSSLDPPNTAYYSSVFVMQQMCDSLLRMQPDGTTKPALATAVTLTDPTTITIDLRTGVKFWDGTEMTSEDVKYSLDHNRNPDTAAGFLFAGIDKVTATAPDQVVIKLTKPNHLVMAEMSGLMTAIFQKKQAEDAGDEFGSAKGGLMCTGPYEFDKWTPGTSIDLKANPDYWDPAYRPHAQRISMKFFTDSTTLASALVSGEIDGAYEVPAQTIPRLSRASNGTLNYGPAPLYLSAIAARAKGPLSDARAREALSMTLDREAIAKVVFNGAAKPYYTTLNTNTWDPNPAAKKLWQEAYVPYEQAGKTYGSPEAITKAKALLEQSGYRGEPVKIIIPAGDRTQSQVAQLLQQQAKSIGMDVSISPLTSIKYSDALSNEKDRGDADLVLAVSFNLATDPLEPLPFVVETGSFYNYTKFSDPQVDALVAQAKEASDPVERTKLLIQVQTIYEKQHLSAPLVELNEISFVNKRLSGMVTSFNYMSTPSMARIGAAG